MRVKRAAEAVWPVLLGLFSASIVEAEVGLSGPSTLLGACAGLAAASALWRRRVFPFSVLLVAAAGGAVLQLLAPSTVFPYAALIALYGLASRCTPVWSLTGLAVVLGVTSLDFLTQRPGDAGFAMMVPPVAWALGEAARSRRRAVAEASRRAAADEQARIGRELHDVVAHSVSVIVVQAAAADDVFEESPEQARAALRSIEAAGRSALAELRSLLAGVHGQPVTPAPGLDRLPELAGQVEAAGLPVSIQRVGSGAVPAVVDASAYRIVQEALTNSLRHAGASRASVLVRSGPSALEVEVLDDGAGSSPGPGGRGLAGMRERAGALGGTVEAGPAPGGGFRVRAMLPIR